MYLFAELLHLCGLVCILCTPRTCTCMYVAAVRSCRCCVFKVLCCVTSPPLEIPALRTFCSVASSRPKIPTLRTLRRITPVQIARTQDVLLHHAWPKYPHSGWSVHHTCQKYLHTQDAVSHHTCPNCPHSGCFVTSHLPKIPALRTLICDTHM